MYVEDKERQEAQDAEAKKTSMFKDYNNMVDEMTNVSNSSATYLLILNLALCLLNRDPRPVSTTIMEYQETATRVATHSVLMRAGVVQNSSSTLRSPNS